MTIEDIEDTFPGCEDEHYLIVDRRRVCEKCTRSMQDAEEQINLEALLGEPEPSRRRLEDIQQRLRKELEELQELTRDNNVAMWRIDARIKQLGESPAHTSEKDEEPK